MSEDENTEAGEVDDDALKRAKKRKKSQQSQLDAIFSDNKTGRYGPGTDS